jgi:hypothetical protein
MSRRRHGFEPLMLIAVLLGCGGKLEPIGEGTGGGPAVATLIGPVDTQAYCNTVGTIEIEVRARRIGCDPDSTGPCTVPSDPPPIVGDKISCPSTDDQTRLGVDIDEPGVYQVEAVGRSTTGDEQVDCFAPVGTPMGGSPDVEVRGADIEGSAQIELQPGPGPCPEP